MSNNYSFGVDKRIDELHLLLKENDLNLATRRLMDFVGDIDLGESIRAQAVQLRANYNYAQMLEEDSRERKEEQVVLDFLQLLSTIELEMLEKEIDKQTLESAQKRFIKDKYLVYNELPEREDVFRAEKITKTYRSFPFTLYNIDLNLRAGEITGVVGENGNGKTTLLRIVAGELNIDSGELNYPALKLSKQDWYYIKHHIAFIPQRLPKWKGLLKDNLHFSAANHGIFGAQNEETVDFIIHRLGLSRYKNARWKDISSGYRLRFELARALVWKPKLLVLDEPLANLDINAKLLFMQDLRLLSNSMRYPIAILMSSQQLHEVENVVDNIMFLKEGKCVYNGNVNEFGLDRHTNTYELSGNFERAELQSLMQLLTDDFRIEDTGQSLVIDVPTSISSSQVLLHLAAKKELDYFRDISKSTRKLF